MQLPTPSAGLDAPRWPRPTWLEWACLAIGLVLVVRYAWLMDDAFVYFRYVDNFVWLGLGPVYNQGEFAEGYSSPFWMLYLSGARALGLDFWWVTLGTACLAFVAFWALFVHLHRRQAEAAGSPNLALAFLAGNYAVLCYFTSGLETPLVQVLAGLYALYFLGPAGRTLDLALALSPLVRQELVLPLACAVAWSRWRDGRLPWRLLGWSTLFCGGWMVFRILYYADLFPTTYHLKNALLVGQGLLYLHDTLQPYHLYPLLALGIVVAFRRRRAAGGKRPWEAADLALLGVAALVSAYVVKIGGDARHYRYLAFPFCLGILLLARLFAPAVARLRSTVARQGLGWAVLALSLVSYPRQLLSHPLLGRPESNVIDGICDAQVHRSKRGLRHEVWREEIDAARQVAYREAHPSFTYRDTETEGWCKTAYVEFDVRIVHWFGLTDPFLARVDAPVDRPAHLSALGPMAREIVELIRHAEGRVGPGLFRGAVEEGRAPPWVVQNLATLERIERRAYNHHDFLENLGLALRPAGRIQLARE